MAPKKSIREPEEKKIEFNGKGRLTKKKCKENRRVEGPKAWASDRDEQMEGNDIGLYLHRSKPGVSKEKLGKEPALNRLQVRVSMGRTGRAHTLDFIDVGTTKTVQFLVSDSVKTKIGQSVGKQKTIKGCRQAFVTSLRQYQQTFS